MHVHLETTSLYEHVQWLQSKDTTKDERHCNKRIRLYFTNKYVNFSNMTISNVSVHEWTILFIEKAYKLDSRVDWATTHFPCFISFLLLVIHCLTCHFMYISLVGQLLYNALVWVWMNCKRAFKKFFLLVGIAHVFTIKFSTSSCCNQ